MLRYVSSTPARAEDPAVVAVVTGALPSGSLRDVGLTRSQALEAIQQLARAVALAATP